jgi:hypothetical protein
MGDKNTEISTAIINAIIILAAVVIVISQHNLETSLERVITNEEEVKIKATATII